MYIPKILSSIVRLKREGEGTTVSPQPTRTGSFVHISDTLGQSHVDDQPTQKETLLATEEPEIVGTSDLAADDIVIAVMGPTGSGKSTFVCAASGRDTSAIGHKLKSYTNQVAAVKFWDHECNRHIVLVDTPGFDDTFKSDFEILNMISDWLVSSYNHKKLLSGILYLHRITDNRVAGSSLKNLRIFRKLCGKDALESVYLTTTMWDEVEMSVGERRLEELKSEYWKTMIAQGAQIARCRNDDDSPKTLLRQIIRSEKLTKAGDARTGTLAEPLPLVQETPRQILLIQEEMVELKKELKETAAGQQLYSQLEILVEKQLVLLRRISKEKKGISDPHILGELQTEYSEVQAQVEDRLRQMRELKLSWRKRFFARRRD